MKTGRSAGCFCVRAHSDARRYAAYAYLSARRRAYIRVYAEECAVACMALAKVSIFIIFHVVFSYSDCLKCSMALLCYWRQKCRRILPVYGVFHRPLSRSNTRRIQTVSAKHICSAMLQRHICSERSLTCGNFLRSRKQSELPAKSARSFSITHPDCFSFS